MLLCFCDKLLILCSQVAQKFFIFQVQLCTEGCSFKKVIENAVSKSSSGGIVDIFKNIFAKSVGAVY